MIDTDRNLAALAMFERDRQHRCKHGTPTDDMCSYCKPRPDTVEARTIAKQVARQCHTWPGGYELFAITDDGGVLCFNCCRTEFRLIATSYQGDGRRVVGIGNASELDERIYCDHCNRGIE